MSGYVFRKLIIQERGLRTILEHPTLSDGAKAFYSYLYTLPSGYYLHNEEFVERGVCTSVQMVNKFKRELKALRVYFENKDRASNIKFAYLGSIDFNAELFAKQWEREEI